MKRGAVRTFLVGLALAASATAALAHHPMGAQTPATLLHGLLSGLGHPVIGIDHFAAVVGVGCLAALHRSGIVLALGYVLATIVGVAVLLRGASVPGDEILVALSVLLLGAVVIWRRPIGTGSMTGLFGLTGLLHGYVLGEAIVGAEATPIVAYFVGLAVVQSAIAVAVLMLVRSIMAPAAVHPLPWRLVGAAVFAVGAVALVLQFTPGA